MASITKYSSWRENAENGVYPINWSAAGDTIKVMLVTSAYTPAAATHTTKSDITNEVTGTNYTARGEEVTTKSVAESGGTTTVDGDDVTWLQNAGGFTTARYGVLYKDTGTDGTSPLVGYIDFTTDKGNVNGDLTIQWNASGLYTIS